MNRYNDDKTFAPVMVFSFVVIVLGLIMVVGKLIMH
jgi:hypothetical protein